MKMISVLSLLLTATAALAVEKGYVSTQDGPAEVYYEMKDGVAIFEGDIEIEPFETPDEITIEGAGKWFKRRRWSNRTVPYVVDPNLPNKERIEWAVKHYAENTQIRFVPRTNEKSYVYFKYNGPDGGCNSALGRRGGKQIIRLPDWCSGPSVVHEMAHALGMIHEQTRNDRDDYLKVHWDNIIPSQKHNFRRCPFSNKDYTAFDFDSVMLYHPWGFAIDPSKPTLTKKDGTLYETQRNGLSDLDKETLRIMYNY